MRQALHQVDLPTRGRGFYEITNKISPLLKDSGLTQGLATLLLQHSSASLLIQENADPNVRGDFERFSDA